MEQNEPENPVSAAADSVQPTPLAEQSTPQVATPTVNTPKYGAVAELGTAWRMGEKVITDSTPQQTYETQRQAQAMNAGNLGQMPWGSGQAGIGGYQSGQPGVAGTNNAWGAGNQYAVSGNPDPGVGNLNNANPGGYGAARFAQQPAGQPFISNNSPAGFGQMRNPALPQALPGRGWPIFGLIFSLCAALLFAPAVFIGGTIGTMLPIVQQADGKEFVETNKTEFSVKKGYAMVIFRTSKVDGWKVEATLDGKPIEEDLYGMSDSLEEQATSKEKRLTYYVENPGKLQLIFKNTEDPEQKVIRGTIADGISISYILGGFVASGIIGFAGLVGIVISIIMLIKRNRLRREVMLSRGLYN